jgi:phenylacetic acid degradation operon negative regulatory protein
MGRIVLYTLTARSEAVLAEGDRRIFSLGRPVVSPERWTMLWHAIPQGQRLARSRLRRRLRFLGFGPVQDGMWVAPHDREVEVAEVLRQLGVESHAGVLVGHPAESLDFRAVVERAWNLDELSTRYREFVTEFGPYRAPELRAALDDRGAFMVRTRLVHLFRAFPFLDPELPPNLVVQPASRAEAIELFHELYAQLDDAAQRYFGVVTTPADAGRRAS